jgi:amino acid permease
MGSDASAMFTRDELLGGLSARRATTALFAIENRTAHLMATAPQAVPIVLSERAATARERAFLEAVAQGRDLPISPTIQDLERHASDWRDLVPEDSSLRAGVARILGSKYTFTHATTPRLRTALGLDTDAVGEAYQRLFGSAIETIYVPQVGPADRVRWTASRLAGRLDALPAFWIAFFVTLIIGAVNLALPIAVAGVGAIPGVVLIVALGLVNLVTVAAMVEVVTRSGSIRYGNAFIGTVVADYLGGASSAILSIVLAAFSFGLLLIMYIGISTTLADATALPAPAWMIVLFGVGLFFLSRGSLNATMASAIVITLVNIGLLGALTVLAFTHLDPENLAYVNLPWTEGGSFSPIVIGALVGVILDIYAAHVLVAIFGKTLLERDPGGRSVLRGHATGIGFAMVLNIAWVLAVCGAIAPEVLAAEPTTALVPLAEEVGPEVRVLGAIFVVLSMGLGLIQFSLALFNLARERLGQGLSWIGTRGRFVLALAPVIAVLLVAEWMVLTGTGSFAGILGFLGVMVHSLMSGIFPMLLLVASRRKGELMPGISYRALGHPVVVGGVVLLFFGSLVLHGVAIWEHPLQRLGGVGMALAVGALTISLVRRGAFAPRAVVELRADRRPDERSRVNLTVAGSAVAAGVVVADETGDRTMTGTGVALPTPGMVRSIELELPAGPAREVKVWTHSISADGISEPAPARLAIVDGPDRREVDLAVTGGQAVMPVRGDGPVHLVVELPPQPG